MVSVSLNASVLSKKEIKKAALNFIAQEALFPENGQSRTIALIEPLRDSRENPVAWVAHLFPEGFVVLSADWEINPILGYSHNSRFAGHPETITMIRTDIDNRRQALTVNKEVSQKNRLRWQNLLIDTPSFQKTTKVQNDSIHYFPTPVWGQGYVNGYATFNYYTPNHWSVGCVGTAMAEVLAYYQWPPSGTGSHSYHEDDAGTLSADYQNTWYDWPNTLFQYKDFLTNPAQRQAAGLLSLHTAIAVEMDFESSGSTAETADAPAAFHQYFRLSGHYNGVNTSGFWSAMENNMKDARPAILSIKTSGGLGHSVAVDGFSESNGYYHLNMGWDGDDNGFYDISGSWNAGGYSIVVGAAKGLVPNPMILEQVETLSEKEYILAWSVSPKQRAQYYELQQATSSTGPWSTLSAAIADTFYTVTVSEVRNYYYRVRTRRNNIWWDWSAVQKITMGTPRQVTFNVNMKYQTLNDGDSLVVRGNIEPLFGSRNSAAFEDGDGDLIFSLTVPFDFDHVGQELSYRFAIAGAGGTTMEAFNRTHTIGWDEFQNLDTVYFDNYVSVKEEPFSMPQSSVLFQNYPNPFNPSTAISYQLSALSEVQLAVYNVLGQEVRILVKQRQKAGKHSVVFNAQGLPSGIYYYRLKAAGEIQSGKMILLQ